MAKTMQLMRQFAFHFRHITACEAQTGCLSPILLLKAMVV
jgi:hypothetical protein